MMSNPLTLSGCAGATAWAWTLCASRSRFVRSPAAHGPAWAERCDAGARVVRKTFPLRAPAKQLAPRFLSRATAEQRKAAETKQRSAGRLGDAHGQRFNFEQRRVERIRS